MKGKGHQASGIRRQDIVVRIVRLLEPITTKDTKEHEEKTWSKTRQI
jgi:hypothetical protein